MFVLIFFTILSETFLVLRRIPRHITIDVHKSLCKVLVVQLTYIVAVWLIDNGFFFFSAGLWYVKVKQTCYSPGVAQRVPGS